MNVDQAIALGMLAFFFGGVVVWGITDFLDEVWNVARKGDDE